MAFQPSCILIQCKNVPLFEGLLVSTVCNSVKTTLLTSVLHFITFITNAKNILFDYIWNTNGCCHIKEKKFSCRYINNVTFTF